MGIGLAYVLQEITTLEKLYCKTNEPIRPDKGNEITVTCWSHPPSGLGGICAMATKAYTRTIEKTEWEGMVL